MKRRAPLPLPEALGKKISLVVIGCSAGGFESLQTILPAFGPTFPVPIVVVIHMPPDRDSLLPQAFARKCFLPVSEVEDKEPMLPAHIYFAPPGYHLLVEKDSTFSLSLDEPVLYSRPSIDVLFESAAHSFGERALGIVLSGANSDGAAGLKLILDAGGYGLVEDPRWARYSMMPQAAETLAGPQLIGSNVELADFLKLIKG
ncbi:MAG: chemotaxis protein CheB [Proteobacteria bacterium]|nr:MAG: chemotaxis protein CheB [Pseudomonadota bacterium]